MPVVYCTEDGQVMSVQGRTGRAAGTRHQVPEGEAFSVGITDEEAEQIEADPTAWRFVGEQPADGRRMRDFKAMPRSMRDQEEPKAAKAARDFAAKVAEKRTRARVDTDTAAMLPGARPVR